MSHVLYSACLAQDKESRAFWAGAEGVGLVQCWMSAAAICKQLHGVIGCKPVPVLTYLF